MTRQRWWSVGVLAVLAYVPLLLAAPGRMVADSKLYLYLDPGRFLGDAATTFDPRQFAGWVPHQHIAYLWPAGPWYWLFEAVGVPDWIAHRLWVGTLFLAAGLGVRWCARLLGLTPAAALAAALVYQLSPYVLPYASRTSVMLLPWAGLGWIVGLTVRAGRRADSPSRLTRWADPAALALVVLTVGAVNATALAMIVPAPILWLIHAVWLRDVSWRNALGAAVRIGVLSAGVSVWWAVMLTIQGRHGADVLPYSESLADVSFTATSTEVWRSLGYWLFYVRDRFAPTTTAALPYLSSSWGLLVSFTIPIGALLALTWVRWRHRRFTALLIAGGLILAVGVHPIDDRSPLMRVLTGTSDEGLALALRSSTRAVPMAVLGFGLAIGAAVQALAAWRSTVRAGQHRRVPTDWLAAALIGVVTVVNLPALWTGDLVDPALRRDQDPPQAWQDAAADLSDPTTRVLQLPGLEFGAFRWGYTVDQPLAGLADSPLVTRDLLPLGSPAAMDLLYALDDRVQDGVLEPAAVAPIARLLGTAAIWLSNDAAYERFDVTAPPVVRAWLDEAPGLGTPLAYGAESVDVPEVAMDDARALGRSDAPVAPVEVYPVDGAPAIARAATGALVVSGSGDGLVDAAAAGLLPEFAALLYSAATDDVASALAHSAGLLVTDSNRDRARHWRSSQDTTGFTESAGRDGAAPTELTETAVGDARLPVFAEPGEAVDPATQTTAEQRGPVIARASSYGQPFALLPEHRPFMAVDGDPATAWIVAEHGDPIGHRIELAFTGDLPTTLTAHQFAEFPGQRQIATMTLRAFDAAGAELGSARRLDAPFDSIDLGLDPATARITLTIDEVVGGVPATESIVAGVGFTELDFGLGPTVEVVRPPSDALAELSPETPLTLLFSRLRSDPADRWRSDPEPVLTREFTLPTDREFAVIPTVRLDARAPDAALAELLGWPAIASSRLLGRPEHAGPAAIDGDTDTAWITGFDASLGASLTINAISEPVAELTVRQPSGAYTPITELTLMSGSDQRTVAITPGADGTAHVTIDPPLAPGSVTVTITGTTPAFTIDRRFGDEFELPAAISELELAGLPALPDYSAPTALTDCVTLATVGDAPLAAMLTTGDAPTGPAWLGTTELVSVGCPRPSTVALPAGTHAVESADTGLPVQLDRLVLAQPFRATPQPPSVEVGEHGRRDRTLAVTECPDGCWVILGEGYNDAWHARIGGTDLGAPTLVDGGFTGWWVAPELAAGGAFRVDVSWTAQRPLTIAYAVTLAMVVICLAVVVRHAMRRSPGELRWERPRPRRANLDPHLTTGSPPPSRARLVVTAATWVIVGFLLVGVAGALAGALGAAGLVLWRGRRVPELTATACLITLAGAVLLRERRYAPLADGGWPHAFEHYHGVGMFAIAAVVVAALCADDANPEAAGATSLPSSP